jgi:3'-phosphoadenosine 5'-phosphosulfate sulfotransferase (PAPS reductase)/FAD synthetase
MTSIPAPNADAIAALPSADWIVVNTSAGKDSSVTLDYTLELADSLGIDHSRIVAVHCDLGRVEWEGTPELAERQVDRYADIRFFKVARDGTVRKDGKVLGDLVDQVWERHEANQEKAKTDPKYANRSPWPTTANRWCTSDQKESQVTKLITSLVDDILVGGTRKDRKDAWVKEVDGTYTQRPIRIINVMGMRAEESEKRSQMPEWSLDESASNGKRTIWNWLAIKDWSEEQVWDRIHAQGIEYHWAYDKGMERLSCCFCVLASPKNWAIALPHNRQLAESYAEMERRTGHAMVERANGTKVSIQDIIDAADRAAAA